MILHVRRMFVKTIRIRRKGGKKYVSSIASNTDTTIGQLTSQFPYCFFAHIVCCCLVFFSSVFRTDTSTYLIIYSVPYWFTTNADRFEFAIFCGTKDIQNILSPHRFRNRCDFHQITRSKLKIVIPNCTFSIKN